MKVLKFEIEGNFLEVECFFDENNGLKELLQKVKVNLAKKLKIKGFREGQFPVDLLEQHVKSSTILDNLAQAAQEKAVEVLFAERKATLANKYRLFEVKVEKISFSECQIYLKWQKLPTVKIMQWKDFKCNLKTPDINEQEIANKINEIGNYFAAFAEVDKEVADNDFAFISYAGKVNGKVDNTLTNKGLNYQLGKKQFGDEFDQQLLGMIKGTEKTFSTTLPKHYLDPKLAGKKVQFNVKLVKVQKKELPEPAKLIQLLKMDKIKTLADLKILITESIKKNKLSQMRSEIIRMVWPQIEKQSTFDIPHDYLSSELTMMKSRYLEDLKSQKKTLEQVLKERQITEKDLDNEFILKIKKTLSDYLLINEIANLEKITVPDKDIDDYYQFLSKNQNKKIEEVKKIYSRPLLFNNLLRFRVEDLLFQNTLEFNGLAPKSNKPQSP